MCKWNDDIIAYISVLHFPHPKRKNLKKVHRLVVLPDYQGIGIGITLLNQTALLVKENENKVLGITSSITNLFNALKKNKKWLLKRKGRVSSGSGAIHNSNKKGSTSCLRPTYTFEYKNNNK